MLSCLSRYVLPSSPRNYNALYRTISRRSLSLHPGGFLRCVPCVLAVCICTRCIVAMLRYVYAAAWCFFSCNKRRVCGGVQKIIYLIYAVAYNIYYILVRNGHYKICAFAICKQTDVSHANRRHWAACVFAPVHLLHAVHCGGVRKVCLPVCAFYIRDTPPRRGTRSRNAAILRNFFIF